MNGAGDEFLADASLADDGPPSPGKPKLEYPLGDPPLTHPLLELAQYDFTEADLAAKGYGPDGRRLNPMRVMGEPPAVEEQNTTGSERRAVVALRTPEATGLSGLQSPTKPLSTRAIAKLQPEQRLQIEVVQYWRPRLAPGARLLGINGELPSRREQSLLFANCKQHFQQEWYWSSEVHASGARYAWFQGFHFGCQGHYRTLSQLRARAVRRLPI